MIDNLHWIGLLKDIVPYKNNNTYQLIIVLTDYWISMDQFFIWPCGCEVFLYFNHLLLCMKCLCMWNDFASFEYDEWRQFLYSQSRLSDTCWFYCHIMYFTTCDLWFIWQIREIELLTANFEFSSNDDNKFEINIRFIK